MAYTLEDLQPGGSLEDQLATLKRRVEELERTALRSPSLRTTVDGKTLIIGAGTGDTNRIELTGGTNPITIVGGDTNRAIRWKTVSGELFGVVGANSISSGAAGYAALIAYDPQDNTQYGAVEVRTDASLPRAVVKASNGTNTPNLTVHAADQSFRVGETDAGATYLALVDGLAVPSAISGYALIYVDTNDGDLKVKFGDDTVKTLATDTP